MTTSRQCCTAFLQTKCCRLIGIILTYATISGAISYPFYRLLDDKLEDSDSAIKVAILLSLLVPALMFIFFLCLISTGMLVWTCILQTKREIEADLQKRQESQNNCQQISQIPLRMHDEILIPTVQPEVL
jgi:hypothetical protein